jgi:hypothetical protein
VENFKDKCNHCGSEDMEFGVRFVISGSAADHTVGPVYKTKSLFGTTQESEPVYVDICKSCGNIRFWIMNTKRDWVK